MSHKKLLKLLKRSSIRGKLCNELGQVFNLSTWNQGAVEFIEGCSAFYLDEPLKVLPIDEILASSKAMKEAEVFKLPAALTYLEVSCEMNITSNVEEVKSMNSTLQAILEVNTQCNPYMNQGEPEIERRRNKLLRELSKVDSVIEDLEAESHREKATVRAARLAIMASGDLIKGVFLRQSEWPKDKWISMPLEGSITAPILSFHSYKNEKDIFINSIRQHAVFAITALIVLLCTKGVEVERVEPKHCNLISRDVPEDAYTIVHIKQAIAKQHLGGTIDERKRTRLHMRRGHVRHQKYGPRWCHEKVIWIPPVLVGYEEEGRIEHDYLVEE